MKKLILILAKWFYYSIFFSSLVIPGFFGAIKTEYYAVIFISMIAFTNYFSANTKLSYFITAHLLVILSLHIPIVVYNMEEAKNIYFGYPFSFITQDHVEWLEVMIHDGEKFPVKKALSPPQYGYIKQTNYWAMLCSIFIVFLLLIISRFIFKSIFELLGFQSRKSN